MKRPKIADMTQLELGRFRLLQFYRGARRQLDHLKYVDETEMTPAGVQKLNKLRLEMRTVIMGIRPSRIEKAGANEVLRDD